MINLKRNKHIALALLCSLFIHGLSAQAILDGFAKKPGEGTIVVNYSWEQYDRFKFGTTTRGAPLSLGGEITTQTVGLFANYGLFKNLNLVVSLPYVSISGAGDKLERDQDVSGFQDVAAYLKWLPYQANIGNGTLAVAGAIGTTTPVEDYAADDILSLGNGATTLETKALVQYKSHYGFFANAQAGFSFRSNNVPNATILSGKVGYAGAKFYLDVCLRSQISDPDAPDIHRPAIPFYENRVNFTQLGVNGYYPLSSNVGLVASFMHYVAGRNAVLPTGYSGGIVYNWGMDSSNN